MAGMPVLTAAPPQAMAVASRTVYGLTLAATVDQSGILKQIEIIHYPTGKEFSVNLLIGIVKDILSDCVAESSQAQNEDPTSFGSLTPSLQSAVNELSTELACISLNVEDDVHSTTVKFFNKLSEYAWEAKMSLMLAALVTIYGEYWVLIQTNSEKQLAKDMATLLQLREKVPESKEQKSAFDELNRLIRSMVDLTESIVKMKEMLFSFSPQNSENEVVIRSVTNTIIIASYWTVRNVVLCTSYIHSLFGKVYTSRVEPGDIDTMIKKISDLRIACLETTNFFVPAKTIKWRDSSENEWEYKPQGPIVQIIITHGSVIDSISFTSVNPYGGSLSRVKFGVGGGINTVEVKFDCPEEVLMGISGTYGATKEKVYVQSLKFHTNLREHGPIGTQGDTPFSCLTEDGVVVGFHGRSEKSIDDIGVFVKKYNNVHRTT